ncbi:hypothetical protein HPB48_005678 [Haemaphysalis longicornis]|uniref:Uncharacterized protein n=1 Tax=Haemaphysalis longicornis TaxID=44386 RepID=A0A9J6GN62_HAELO|nr:hypothetical protein HPB48_005678 [Haemaphysalis longicornis]
MNRESCDTISTKPGTNQPLFTFTRQRDPGGLLHPSEKLLFALDTLRVFAEQGVKENPTLPRPVSTLVDNAVPILCSSKLLECTRGSEVHRLKLMTLIAVRFLKPLLAIYEFGVRDRHDTFKFTTKKPLSRQYPKL